MLRSISAIAAGVAVWLATRIAADATVLNVFDDRVLAGGRIDDVGVLVLIITYVTAFQVLAGFTTAWLAPREALQHVLALALVQLALGVIFTIAYRANAPLWYHFTMLALVVPAVMIGGMLYLTWRERRPVG